MNEYKKKKKIDRRVERGGGEKEWDVQKQKGDRKTNLVRKTD